MKFTGWKIGGYAILFAAMIALSSCGNSNGTQLPEDENGYTSDSTTEVISNSTAESVVEIISDGTDTTESESSAATEDEDADSKSETGQTEWKMPGMMLSLEEAVDWGGIFVRYPESDSMCVEAVPCRQMKGDWGLTSKERYKIRAYSTYEPAILREGDELILASTSTPSYAPTKLYPVYDQGYSLLWRGDTGDGTVGDAELMPCNYDKSRNAVYIIHGTGYNLSGEMLVAIDGQTPEEYFSSRGEEILFGGIDGYANNANYESEIETDDVQQVTLTFMEGTKKVDYTTWSVPWFKYNGPTYEEDLDANIVSKEPDQYYTINLNLQGAGDGYVPYDMSTVKNQDGESVTLPAGKYVVKQELENDRFYLSVIDVE